MTALLIIVAAIVLLLIGYVGYGSWLAKQWGIDPTKNPLLLIENGRRRGLCCSKAGRPYGTSLFIHRGSRPDQRTDSGIAVFGWVPVFLWCIIGGIFFGGLQDFGSLFASIRHDGKSVGEIIQRFHGKKSPEALHYLRTAGTDPGNRLLRQCCGRNILYCGRRPVTFGVSTNPTGNQTTAMISLLFIVLAIIYGYI